MDAKLWISNILIALLLIIIAPNGHILANIAIVSQLSLAIDLSSKGLPGQLQLRINSCIAVRQPKKPLPSTTPMLTWRINSYSPAGRGAFVEWAARIAESAGAPLRLWTSVSGKVRPKRGLLIPATGLLDWVHHDRRPFLHRSG